MKLSMILFSLAFLNIYATGFNQEAKLTMRHNNVSAKTVFKDIENTTGYRFVYNDETVSWLSDVSVNARNKELGKILDDLLLNSDIEYRVLEDKLIVLTKSTALITQEVRVTGTVTDDSTGEPLPGVSISIKGTTVGTITDVDGRYSLNVTDPSDILVFSFVGYTSLEKEVGDLTTINVSLSPAYTELDEIVIVGYSAQRRITLTGAVGVIEEGQLQDRAVTSVLEAIQGQVSGLNVIRTGGQPGNQNINFNIRGTNTFTSNPVLTIIDGIPSSLDEINPNDIESISVLKDAASTAIYGSRATGGVILVTTKSGRVGAPQINVSSIVSLQAPTRWPEKPTALEYALMHNVASLNDGSSPVWSQADIDRFASPEWKDHDWDGYLINNALQTNQNVSIRGGSEVHNYYLSAGYLFQDGIVINTDYERYNFQLNQDFRIGNRLEISAKTGYSPSNRMSPAQDWSQLRFIYATQKTDPFRTDDGKWLFNSVHTAQGNAMAGLSEDAGQSILKRNRLTGSATATFKILDNLNLSGTYGIISTNERNQRFDKILTIYDRDNPDLMVQRSVDNYLRINNAQEILQYANLIANYNNSIGDHNFSVLAGVTQEWFEMRNDFVQTRDFLTENIFVIDAGSSNPEFWNISGSAADWALQSVISRVNYSFKDKYLLEGSMRYDGSSRFTEDRRWGLFPSVSAGWIVSHEGFLENNRILTFFKLRGSWGQVGNQNVGFYPFANRLSQTAYYFNGIPQRAVRTAGAPNPLLTWETKEAINLGIEGRFFDHMLEFNIDLFNEKTKDILLDLPLPTTYGQPAPVQNAGRVDNRGWELDLRHRNTIGDFGYGISFQISNSINKVIDMAGVSPWIGQATITEEGRPMNEWYGFKADGFFQTEQEVTDHAFQSAETKPGDIRYVDANNDGVIDSRDRVRLGIADPRYPFGVRLNFSYKNFDFTAFGQGVMEHILVTRPWEITSIKSYHLDYWTSENPNTSFPNPRIGGGPMVGINKEFSSFWLEDAAYFRLKHIELGYSLPDELTRRVNIRNARIFVSGENLFTITNYLGYDPEFATGYTIRQVEARYPISRLFNFGINLNF